MELEWAGVGGDVAYLLSWFILLSGPDDDLNSYVSPLTILLMKGGRLMLVPINMVFL